HVDVAGTAAQRTRVPFAGQPDPLSVVDPRRDVDLERPLVQRAPRAAARLARMLDEPPGAAALGTARGADELAEDAARHLLQPPRPVAPGAHGDARAGLDAVTAARGARDGDLDGNGRRRAARGIDEVDHDLRGDVAAARRAAAGAGTGAGAEDVVAEERAEEIAD